MRARAFAGAASFRRKERLEKLLEEARQVVARTRALLDDPAGEKTRGGTDHDRLSNKVNPRPANKPVQRSRKVTGSEVLPRISISRVVFGITFEWIISVASDRANACRGTRLLRIPGMGVSRMRDLRQLTTRSVREHFP